MWPLSNAPSNLFVPTVATPPVKYARRCIDSVLLESAAVETIGGVPFMEFLAPGLITMAIAQNAFANTSSSILVAKVQGNIVDTLMPPLTAHELTLGIAMGERLITRGQVTKESTLERN